MFSTLYLNPSYRVETLEPDTVFFLSERESVCFNDRLYYHLVSRLAAGQNGEEIFDFLQLELLQEREIDRDSPNFFQKILDLSIQIQQAFFQLQQKGYLLDGKNDLPANLAIICHSLQISPDRASERLQGTKVAVKSIGSLPETDFIPLLQSLSISVASAGESSDLTVVLTDDYLHAEIDELHRRFSRDRAPFLLIKPLGTNIWIGPLFHPDRTACYECFARRWRDNRPIEEFIARKKEIGDSLFSPLGFLPSTARTALDLAATELFKWIVLENNPRLEGNLISFDTLTLQIQDHPIVKRPQCPSCGETFLQLNREPLPVVIGHRRKVYTSDGGHRCCSPEETLRKYRHHISPITGIVRELQKLPGDDLIHTYIAKHHFRNFFDNLDSLRQNIGGRSAGKGKTDHQARASAFCEAIERYSGVFQGDEIRERASYRNMGDRAIHPNACLNFSPRQYAEREEWNARCPGWFQRVPEPFDEEREMDWTPVWSLTRQEFRYLPTAYCYYGYPRSAPLDCWADSNGCATGNNLEEAILQGFLELIERDCVALWWYNRLAKPRVDLDSFEEPYFRELREYYRRIDRDLWVIEITGDFAIPCFAAISPRKGRAVEDIVLGYGCHFDPKIAIGRALTEVNQILPNVLPADRAGSTRYPPSADPIALEWWKTATVSNQPYLAPIEGMPARKSEDYPRMASEDLFDDLALCQRMVEEKGLEMLVLEQTRPDIGLRVAKVLVPGLRHMWKRLGPGRLYEVPVAMGWLAGPLPEEEMNPFPMWM